MNTAPVATPASVTVAPGVVIDSNMTPEQRFQAILKANVQPHQLGIGHTDHNVAGMSAAVANPPPSPKALEAANKPGAVAPQGNPSATRQADLDREQQDAGIQTRPDGRRIAVGQRDDEAIGLLTANYRILAHANRDNPAAAARFKAAFENDLKSLLDGKQLSGAQIAELRKRAGRGDIESFVPKTKEPVAPAPSAAPAAPGWKAHVENGEWVGLEHLTLNDTHGFTIPRYVDNQRVHVSTFDMLRDAKAAGISQQQVDAVLTQHAVRAGWVKT